MSSCSRAPWSPPQSLGRPWGLRHPGQKQKQAAKSTAWLNLKWWARAAKGGARFWHPRKGFWDPWGPGCLTVAKGRGARLIAHPGIGPGEWLAKGAGPGQGAGPGRQRSKPWPGPRGATAQPSAWDGVNSSQPITGVPCSSRSRCKRCSWLRSAAPGLANSTWASQARVATRSLLQSTGRPEAA